MKLSINLSVERTSNSIFEFWTPRTNFVIRAKRDNQSGEYKIFYPSEFDEENKPFDFSEVVNFLNSSGYVRLDLLLDKTLITLPISTKNYFEFSTDILFFVRIYGFVHDNDYLTVLAEKPVTYQEVKDGATLLLTPILDKKGGDWPLEIKKILENSFHNLVPRTDFPLIPDTIPTLLTSGRFADGPQKIPFSFLTHYSGPCFGEGWFEEKLQEVLSLRSCALHDIQANPPHLHEFLLFLVIFSHTRKLSHLPACRYYTNGFTNPSSDLKNRNHCIYQVWETTMKGEWKSPYLNFFVARLGERLNNMFIVGKDGGGVGFLDGTRFYFLEAHLNSEIVSVNLREDQLEQGTFLYQDGNTYVWSGETLTLLSEQPVALWYEPFVRPILPLRAGASLGIKSHLNEWDLDFKGHLQFNYSSFPNRKKQFYFNKKDIPLAILNLHHPFICPFGNGFIIVSDHSDQDAKTSYFFNLDSDSDDDDDEHTE